SLSIRVEPDGSVRCLASMTDQGQGTNAAMAQITAAALGVPYDIVSVLSGDSAMTATGSGAWASRTTAIGGELALRAARDLRGKILSVAAALMQCEPDELDLSQGKVGKLTGNGPEISLAEIADIVYFRPQLLPPGPQPVLSVTMQFGHDWPAFVPTNGIQA